MKTNISNTEGDFVLDLSTGEYMTHETAVSMTRQEKIDAEVEAARKVAAHRGMKAVIVSTRLTATSTKEGFGFHFEKETTPITIGQIINNQDGSVARVEAILGG